MSRVWWSAVMICACFLTVDPEQRTVLMILSAVLNVHCRLFLFCKLLTCWEKLALNVERNSIERLSQIRSLPEVTDFSIYFLSDWWSGKRQQSSVARSSYWRWRSRQLTEKKTNRLLWVPPSSTIWIHALVWLGEWKRPFRMTWWKHFVTLACIIKQD